jgi:indolepyruvate ferredoxin oxidoreductase
MERALIDDYEQLLAQVLAPETAVPYDGQVAIAASVMEVKGYGPVKEAAVARWRERVGALRRGDTSLRPQDESNRSPATLPRT